MDHLLEWRRNNISDKAFIFILATGVGLLCGCCAFLLKAMIAAVFSFLVEHFKSIGSHGALFIMPFIGIVLTGLLCRYVMKAHFAHGTEQLIHDLKEKIYRLKTNVTYGPIIASTITLGFGGSAGSEGPIAYSGGGIGSKVAQIFRLPPHAMMLLMGCGAGAGIAGIFKSPLGGALFTLEVLRMPVTTFSALVLIVTTLTAAATAYSLSGFTLDIPFDTSIAFDPSLFPFVIALGVFCGLYSLYYAFIIKLIRRHLEKFRRPWMKYVAGGLILAVTVYCFPVLYGEGYGIIGQVINGDFTGLLKDSPFECLNPTQWTLIFFGGGTILVKCFATSATNYGGGVSGNFAPSLFAGCFAGFFFASLLNTFGLHLPIGHFAFFAMAGVMAGAIRAPLMAIFLVSEMGGAYTFIIPIAVTAAISFGIVRLFTEDSFFTHYFDRHNGFIHNLFHHGHKI